uniref:ATP-binding cassette domain-containing protein n=1 Tax=uncultured Bosea sp. TaxID=211457 RepID=UPI0025D30A4B
MIEFDNVRKSYGPVEVLRGISASLPGGKVSCIIGPSGSGKSTLLRCINGLETYQDGEIRVAGLRADAESFVAIRRKVSMVFQRFNLCTAVRKPSSGAPAFVPA